ncbi:MAG: thioesterase family protein [Pseudomonadota bacterium]
MSFIYETVVRPEWIDYNGHMQDAFYGLVFSYAVDALQDAVGFDRFYREGTGCTIYLLEEHKFFLREVFEGDALRVETLVLDVDEKRFHLHLTMRSRGAMVAVAELVEMHVSKHPAPHGVPMPARMRDALERARAPSETVETLRHRARMLGLHCRG